MFDLTNTVRSLANEFLGRGISGTTQGSPDYKIHISAPDRGIFVSAFLPENFTSTTTSDYDTPFSEGFISNEKIKLGMRMMGMATSTQMMSMQVWQGSAPMDFSIPINFLLDTDTELDVIKPMRQLMSLTMPRQAWSEVENFLESPGPKLRLREGEAPKTIVDRLTLGASGILDDENAGDVVDTATGIRDGINGIFENVQKGEKALSDLYNGNPGAAQAANETLDAIELFNLVEVIDNISIKIGNFMYFDSVVITDVSSDYEIKLDKNNHKPIALNATVGFRTFVTPKAEDLYKILPVN